jgi:hypothetical protein
MELGHGASIGSVHTDSPRQARNEPEADVSGSFYLRFMFLDYMRKKTLLLETIASVTNHGCRKRRLNQNQGMST